MVSYDLHCHTTNSDGSMALEALVKYARRTGLKGIAITDHDVLPDQEILQGLERQYGVQLIPGVEMTTRYKGKPVHLLCYWPKKTGELQQIMDKTQEGRRVSKMAMIQKLKQYYPITEEMVWQNACDSATIFEPHIMKALADLGYTASPMGSLLSRILSGGDCYVPNDGYPDTMATLEIARNCGGVLAVAHPEQFDSFELVEKAAQCGLIQAVEVEHYANSYASRERLMKLAQKYGLICTGGSDFHGANARHPRILGENGCGEPAVRSLEGLSAEIGV